MPYVDVDAYYAAVVNTLPGSVSHEIADIVVDVARQVFGMLESEALQSFMTSASLPFARTLGDEDRVEVLLNKQNGASIARLLEAMRDDRLKIELEIVPDELRQQFGLPPLNEQKTIFGKIANLTLFAISTHPRHQLLRLHLMNIPESWRNASAAY